MGFQTYLIQRAEMEAWWSSWADCHLNINNGYLTSDNSWATLVLIRFMSTFGIPPNTSRQTAHATGKGGAKIPGRLALLVDIGSNVNLIRLRVAMEFLEAALMHGHMLLVLNRNRHCTSTGSSRGERIWVE